MTKTLAIDSWSTLIQSHKLHIYVNDLQVPITFHFPFLTDKHASSIIISTDMYKNYISHSDKHKSYIHILNRYVYQQYPQISIQAVSTLHKDKHMSSIFTSLDKHMSSVYGVHPLSPPNTYPV